MKTKFKEWDIEAPITDKKPEIFKLLKTEDEVIFQEKGSNRIIIKIESDDLIIHTNQQPCQIKVSQNSKSVLLSPIIHEL